MAAWTDIAENKFIDWFFRAQALGINGASAAAGSGPATLYYGLLTTAPTDATAGAEVSGGAYARVAVTSSLVNWAGTQGAGSTTVSTGSSATTSNNGAITFPVPSANWGVVTAMGLYDATTGGNLISFCPLAVNKNVSFPADAPNFPAGTFTFTWDS
jgi:hypothetical protein